VKYIFNIFIICFCAQYAFAMESISEAEMSDITGAVGIDIFVEGTLETAASFQIMAWSDNDGIGGDTVEGYFGVVGTEDSTITVKVSNCKFSVDVGTTTAPLTIENETLEAGKSFLRIGLPQFETDISMADFIVQFADGSKLGKISTSDVSIDMVQTPDALYIWPH